MPAPSRTSVSRVASRRARLERAAIRELGRVGQRPAERGVGLARELARLAGQLVDRAMRVGAQLVESIAQRHGASSRP
jgi:hypothetical protein